MFLAIQNETYLDVTVGSRAGNIPERILFKEYMERLCLNLRQMPRPSFQEMDHRAAKKKICDITHSLLL